MLSWKDGIFSLYGYAEHYSVDINLNYKIYFNLTYTVFLLLTLTYLGGCTISTFDEQGRLVVNNIGLNKYVFDIKSPQFIDLRGSSLVGFYSDSSITIGYKNNQVNRIHFGCRALILTNVDTVHDDVVKIVNESALEQTCISDIQDKTNFKSLHNEKIQSVQLGYSKVSLSPTYPAHKDISAYSIDFWGLEFGDIFGTGFRTTSIISSGDDCFLLLITESKKDFDYYKYHLDFKQGKHLCIVLKP